MNDHKDAEAEMFGWTWDEKAVAIIAAICVLAMIFGGI